MTADLDRATAAIDALSTAAMNLGRHTPRTRAQRADAFAGVRQCEAEWRGDLPFTTSDEHIKQGRSRFWRAAYGIRHGELCRTLVTVADLEDLARWEADGGA
jgi:hypothetical protein